MPLRHSRLSPDLLETFSEVRIDNAALFSSQHQSPAAGHCGQVAIEFSQFRNWKHVERIEDS